MSTRTEEDLLGQREVPDENYYGIHTIRALENFRISNGCMNDEPEFIRGMVQVKKATALANKELHAIQGDIADTICAACESPASPCACSVLSAVPASAGTASLKPCEPISSSTAHISMLRRPAAKRQSSRYRKPIPSWGLPRPEPVLSAARLPEARWLPAVDLSFMKTNDPAGNRGKASEPKDIRRRFPGSNQTG